MFHVRKRIVEMMQECSQNHSAPFKWQPSRTRRLPGWRWQPHFYFGW